MRLKSIQVTSRNDQRHSCLRWSYFVGQSEGDLKVDSDGLQSPRGPA